MKKWIAASIAALAAHAAWLAPAAADVFYTVTNKTDENTIVAYAATEAGYAILGEYGTGGEGTGDLEIPALKKDETHPLLNGDDPLISAFPIVATEDGARVLVVNPGDGTISLMAVAVDKSLQPIGVVAATDAFPVSIAVYGDAAVVASVGPDNGSGSIGAYRIAADGLSLIEGSRRDLGARPSTVKFSTDGRYLIVNELVTGKIHAFAHDGTTLSEAPVSTIDSPRADGRFHAIPVGFEIARRGDVDVVMMTEARFLTPEFELRPGDGSVAQSPKYSWQTSSLSTYALSDDGALSLISGDVLTGDAIEGGEISNCWLVLAKDGRTLWSINPLSSSYSAFDIGEDGAATLLDAQAFKLEPATMFFGDAALSRDGDEIFQLIGNRGQVMVIEVGDDGLLTPTQILGGLPQLGAYGMLTL